MVLNLQKTRFTLYSFTTFTLNPLLPSCQVYRIMLQLLLASGNNCSDLVTMSRAESKPTISSSYDNLRPILYMFDPWLDYWCFIVKNTWGICINLSDLSPLVRHLTTANFQQVSVAPTADGCELSLQPSSPFVLVALAIPEIPGISGEKELNLQNPYQQGQLWNEKSASPCVWGLYTMALYRVPHGWKSVSILDMGPLFPVRIECTFLWEQSSIIKLW